MRGLIILTLLSLTAVNAHADTPFYVGFGIGKSKLQQQLNTQYDNHNFSDEGDSYQLFAGWEINQSWALELGYVDLGKATSVTTIPTPPPPAPPIPPRQDQLEFAADGWTLTGQYRIPLGQYFSVDLSGGWMLADSRATRWNPDPNVINVPTTDSHVDSGAVVGVAVTFKLTDMINLRAAGNYYNIDFDGVLENPYRLGLDLIWDF
jgi:hypothetical protein